VHSLMKRAADFTGLLAEVLLWLSGIALVAMTVTIFAQVFSRYVLNSSIMGSEPASIMIMGWFIFLGAAVGIREGNHLSFDILLIVLPARIKPWLHTLSDIAVAAFGFGMIWFGGQLAMKTAQNTMPSLGISGAFEYLPIIAGGVFAILFTIERILRRLAGLPTARFGEASAEEH
jgi:TRAP-type C4-dicarboxylate transport system permease small subunit